MEIVVVHFVLLSFSNVLQRISIKCFPNSSKLAVASASYSSAMIGVIKTTFVTNLTLPVFQLLMIFSSWWSSEPLMTSTSGEQLMRRCFWWRQLLMIFITTFLQMLPCNTSFHFVDDIALFCSSELMYFKTLNFCLWSCTLEQILSYPIDTFLIPCYHKNLKGNVKHILFQQSAPFWWWQTLVFKMFNCC